MGGVKANDQTIGVTAGVKLNDCSAESKKLNQVKSLAVLAQRAGKGTGFVTTTRITHASPAGTYAHTSNREFECDSDIVKYNQSTTLCRDIATQLILDSTG